MPKLLRVPITNVFGGGDYTVQLGVGSQHTPVNLILDTGRATESESWPPTLSPTSKLMQ